MKLDYKHILLRENGINKEFKLRYIKTNEIKQWKRKSFNLKTVIVIEPKTDFKKDSNIDIIIKSGMAAIEGNLGTRYNSRIGFHTYYTFKYTGKTYYDIQPFCDYLRANFSNPVDIKEFRKHLQFTPEVKIPEISYSWFSAYPSLDFDYKANTHYKLIIDKNLTDKFNQKLGKDVVIEFDVGNYPPYFSIPTGVGIIESYEGKKLPLRLRNPENMKIQTKLINKKTLIPYLLLNNYVYIPWGIKKIIKNRLSKLYNINSEYDTSEEYKPKVEWNKFQIKALYLSKYLKKKKYGLLDLHLSGETGCDYYKNEDKTFLQITDMGITGKFSPEGNLIFVTSLKTGKPLKNINIEIRDDLNKILYNGKTDKYGILRTPGWYDAGLKKYNYGNVRQWAIASKKNDTAFIHSDWGTGISPWRFNINYNHNPVFPKYQGTITTERGIYRPCETVHFKGILRIRKKGNWVISKIKSLKYVLKDSRNKEIKKGMVQLSSYGTFLLDIKIPKDSPTGYYSLKVYEDEKINNKEKLKPIINRVNLYNSFRVEVFQPVQYEVRIRTENKEYYNKDTAEFKVTGWYLFGAPMMNKKIHYVARGQETFYNPPNNPGYNFSVLRWLDNKYYAGSKYFKSETAKLNNKGEIKIPIKLDWGNPVHSFNVWLEATVYGENSQRVSSRKTILVFGSRFYIGIKREKYFVEKGKKAKFKIISVNPDGKRRKNDKVIVKIYRRFWESVRKAEIGGRYRWESRRVDKLIKTKKIITKKQPVDIYFKPKKTGLYYVRAESKDKDGNVVRADEYIYSIGSGYSPWQMKDDDRIELVTEKKKYKPGETAKILIKSPYDKATALITVEREYVLNSWVKQLNGSASVVKIPIKNEYLPNVYIGVSLIKGRIEDKSFTNWGTDLGKPSFKIGYTSINVSPDEKKLYVDIMKSHTDREPGDPLEIKFKVKDINGNPVKSECMVSVCDVGVLNLIGFKTPDFFNTFYGTLPLNVQTSDSRLHIIGQRNYGEKGENRGGGGIKSAEKRAFSAAKNGFDMDIFTFRKNFLSTAFYKGDVITDKNGIGKVKFNMPDNLTTFRIMVVPVARKSFFGAGEDYVVVKKYLMLKSTLPQFTMIDDIFQAGAVVYNYTDNDAKIKVQIDSSNAKIIGSKVKTVFVKKGESSDVRFKIKCNSIGNVKIKIAAVSGKYNDAIEKIFPVKVPRMTESVALFESTGKNKIRQKIIIPDKNEVFGNVGNFSVYLSSSVFSKLKSGIDYLITYPYGCIEQKISKILPIIFSKKLILDLKLTEYNEKTLDNYVKSVLNEIGEYQRYDGGFDYWKDKRWSYPWLTAYISFALLKAEKEGYSINKNILSKAVNFLTRYSRRRFNKNMPYSYYADLSTKSFVAYVLAFYGKPNKTLINNLYKNIYKIPFFGKANLLKAMYYARYKKKYIDKVRRILFNKVKISSTTAHYEDANIKKLWWIHSSSVRATATILQAFLETKTFNPLNDKIANWLVQSQKYSGRYYNTQDNVYAFYAMSEYYKFYEQKKTDFKIKLIVNGEKLLENIFRGRRQSPVLKKFTFDKFKRGMELNADLYKTGVGRIYYSFRLNYAPKKLLKSRDEGIKVEKWYETMDGKKIDNMEFKKGVDYVVVIKVNTRQERHFVMLNDPIPAGFKILNLSFKTESREAYRKIRQRNRWWGSFNHFENYEDKVLLSATTLYFGEHIYRYIVRAVTPGRYLLPPTKAEEMYNPDIFGYYGQRYITVVEE